MSLRSRAPRSGSAFGNPGRLLLVGVTSLSLRSNARPSPRSSDTVLSLSASGVSDRESLPCIENSSFAVLNDSALDEGYANIGGRSRKVVDALRDELVRGGLGSGVGGGRFTQAYTSSVLTKGQASFSAHLIGGATLCVTEAAVRGIAKRWSRRSNPGFTSA